MNAPAADGDADVKEMFNEHNQDQQVLMVEETK